jgi:DNA-binding transcriptional MocR family regulator
VRDRALLPGAQLPAVRALAADLSVSPATVAAAYQKLRQRGIVSTAGRNGTRVRDATPIATLRSASQPQVPSELRDLANGHPDVKLLPVATNYGDGGVLPELRKAARRRLPFKEPAITVVSGAADAIDRVLAAHLRPGDKVAVEDPGWAACFDLLALHGITAVPVPVDEEGPTAEGVRAALERGAQALILTARAQNPTGAAISKQRAAALRPLVRDILVIEDDHAAEIAGVPLHPVADAGAHWAFIRSASKPYGPDLRCCILAGDPETVSRVEGRVRLTAGWVSTILQRKLMELWESVDPLPTAEIYAQRRAMLIEALAAHGIKSYGRTGINVWVPVRDETRAVSALRDAGFAVAPGQLYRLASPPAIRVTVATLAPEEAPQIARLIADAEQIGLRGMLGR